MKWAALKLPRAFREVALVMCVAAAFVIGFGVGSPPPASSDNEVKDEVWTCSMHPQIRLPAPGSCPICGMDLIKLEEDNNQKSVEVTLSQQAKQLARIRTAKVVRARSGVELRLLGRLEYDETSVRTITPWTAGRIDKLFVSNVGAKIKRGQTVASLYSPEVYTAQLDLLTARRQRKRLKDALPIAQRAAIQAEEAAEARLRLLGMSSRAIKKRPSRNIGVRSTFAGTVIEQLVNEGAYVKAGQALFRIADLGRLWAQLDAYEGDLPGIIVGQSVTLEVASYPGESFEGTVAFVDPILDPRTRTAQIRVEIDNHDGRLSRGMFADAVIHRNTKDDSVPLVIPRTAPLFTGKRSLVYVELPDREAPTYEAREVRLGTLSGSSYPVLSGLRENERVVINGAFTLDSDLQIRGGRSMMSMLDDHERAASEPIAVTAAFTRGFAPVVTAYLALQGKLAADDFPGAKTAFGKLATTVAAFKPTSPARARTAWLAIAAKLLPAAKLGGDATDIEQARRHFEQVSMPLLAALQQLGNPLEKPLHAAVCPMAIDKRPARWLQRADEVENPYLGQRMPSCGSIEKKAPPGQRLPADQAPPDSSVSADDAAPAASSGPHQHQHQHTGGK